MITLNINLSIQINDNDNKKYESKFFKQNLNFFQDIHQLTF